MSQQKNVYNALSNDGQLINIKEDLLEFKQSPKENFVNLGILIDIMNYSTEKKILDLLIKHNPFQFIKQIEEEEELQQYEQKEEDYNSIGVIDRIIQFLIQLKKNWSKNDQSDTSTQPYQRQSIPDSSERSSQDNDLNYISSLKPIDICKDCTFDMKEIEGQICKCETNEQFYTNLLTTVTITMRNIQDVQAMLQNEINEFQTTNNNQSSTPNVGVCCKGIRKLKNQFESICYNMSTWIEKRGNLFTHNNSVRMDQMNSIAPGQEVLYL